jgi:predicted nucleic acid-binding Zn ribbon protein
MPMYTSRCSLGHRHTIYAKIIDRDEVRQCPDCGGNLLRVLEAPMVHGDIGSYVSPVSGKWIDSSSARRDDLKRAGCIPWEPGIRQDAPRRKAYADEKAFAPLAQTIEQTARDLTVSGKMPTL